MSEPVQRIYTTCYKIIDVSRAQTTRAIKEECARRKEKSTNESSNTFLTTIVERVVSGQSVRIFLTPAVSRLVLGGLRYLLF